VHVEASPTVGVHITLTSNAGICFPLHRLGAVYNLHKSSMKNSVQVTQLVQTDNTIPWRNNSP